MAARREVNHLERARLETATEAQKLFLMQMPVPILPVAGVQKLVWLQRTIRHDQTERWSHLIVPFPRQRRGGLPGHG
jgi:hypothetical protein